MMEYQNGLGPKHFVWVIAGVIMICWSLGCRKGFQINSIEVSSIDNGGRPQGMTPKLYFKQGPSLTSEEVSEDLEVLSSQIEDVSEIQLQGEGIIEQRLSKGPFTFRVMLIKKREPIPLLAIAKFKDGSTETAKMTLTPRLSGSGTIDPNCMNNSQFDACIFWKSPVAHNNAPFTPSLSYGRDLSSVQTYGIKLSLLDPQVLKNENISSIRATSGQIIKLNSEGNYKYTYAADSKNHYNAQLMAFFWVDQAIEIFKKKAGRFYAGGKGLKVDAFITTDNDAHNNAFWNGQEIIMGFNDVTGNHEMALGADVYIHELGHADQQFAGANSNDLGESYCPGDRLPCFCKTKLGCIRGINEGQADFHTAFIFSQNPVLGEQFANSLTGLPLRNVLGNKSLSVDKAFQIKRKAADGNSYAGEEHDMGAVYASILWEMYIHPKMNPRDFAKMFEMHLAKLTASQDFMSTKAIFQAIDLTFYNSKYKDVIDEVYRLKGL